MKDYFKETAKRHGFEMDYGCWYKESSECIVVLNLQKSKFSNKYQLMIKVFIQGLFGEYHTKSLNLFKKELGNVFRSTPPEMDIFFDADNFKDDEVQLNNFEILFSSFLIPFTTKALKRRGLIELNKNELIFLTQSVKDELNMLITR